MFVELPIRYAGDVLARLPRITNGEVGRNKMRVMLSVTREQLEALEHDALVVSQYHHDPVIRASAKSARYRLHNAATSQAA